MSEIMMDVDRTNRLEYPPMTRAVLHADLRLLRPSQYVFGDLEPWLLESQAQGSVSAYVIYERLKQEKLLCRNIGFDDQLAIAQQVPITAVPEHLRGKWFPSYAGMLQGDNSHKSLPVLIPLHFYWHIL